MKKVLITGNYPIQISPNLKDNLAPGPRPISISDEVYEDIKGMIGVELYEEDTPEEKPKKTTKKVVDTEKE